ncbi:MAG: HEAT repeat domain-containing protein [Rhodomicrobium sp.]|uniref:HEAT repeat domain-containing protein n=1 Tax=Rhodoblastus sp. TaxID=1962975 RepID=UPI003F951B84
MISCRLRINIWLLFCAASLALFLAGCRQTKDVSDLIADLKNAGSSGRANAAEALGRLKDPRAVEPLIAALDDKEYKVRAKVAGALGAIKDRSAVEPLIAVLKDTDASVRAIAAEALGAIEDQRAVDPLIAALKDSDYKVRAGAAGALGTLKSGSAAEPLIPALKDNISDVRTAAIEALGEIGDQRAVTPLSEALNGEDPQIRALAEKALRKVKAEELNEQARGYYRLGSFRYAADLFRQALAIQEKTLQADHLDIATTLSNIASAEYADKQDNQTLTPPESLEIGAGPLFFRAFEIREKALPPDHPDLIMSFSDLAGVVTKPPEYDHDNWRYRFFERPDAELQLKAALEVREQLLPKDHPDIERSRYGLIHFYEHVKARSTAANIERLKSAYWATRRQGAINIVEIVRWKWGWEGKDVVRAVPYLIDALSDGRDGGWGHIGTGESVSPSREAQKALLAIGEPAVDPLISVLNESSIGCDAMDILGKMMVSRAVIPLIGHLGPRNHPIYCGGAAASVLGEWFRKMPPSEEAMGLLINDLRSGDQNTKIDAIVAVKHVRDERLIEPLLLALNSAMLALNSATSASGHGLDPKILDVSVKALEKFDKPEVIDVLGQVLRNPQYDIYTRAEAANALGHFHNNQSTQILMECLEDYLRSDAKGYALEHVTGAYPGHGAAAWLAWWRSQPDQ